MGPQSEAAARVIFWRALTSCWSGLESAWARGGVSGQGAGAMVLGWVHWLLPLPTPYLPPSRNPRSRDLRFDYFQILVCVKFDLRKHFSPTCCRIEGV